MNKFKASKEDKKVFNYLNKLIIDINNNMVKKEDAVERLNKSISELKQKQSTAFQNKLIHVVYQLFNSVLYNLVLIKSLHHYFTKQSQSRLKKNMLN